MSTLRRPDAVVPEQVIPRARDHWRRVWVICAALLLGLAPSLQAQAGGAQRAIEALERCNKEEKKSGCINILKQQPAGEGKQAIKAQVRGGRIIWYEYDRKTGAVRRTN